MAFGLLLVQSSLHQTVQQKSAQAQPNCRRRLNSGTHPSRAARTAESLRWRLRAAFEELLPSAKGKGRRRPRLVDWALEILDTADPDKKARLGDLAATQWLNGAIPLPFDPAQPPRAPPDRPARSDAVRLLPPSRAPKLGKGGSAQSRLAMLHSLAHTESWAVDLSWDIVARFGARLRMPREFFDDFARVAQDEGRHFAVLSARLRELGSHYGALPAHDGLWDSAMRTSHCLLARLAVEHCVHEARGLDVLPTTISRFQAGGDEQTAKLLEDIIYPEEITHCAAGVRWFRYLCLRSGTVNPIAPSIP